MTHDQLLAYLASDDNKHGLDPVAAHGFLCAVAVSTWRKLPNWLACFFEGQPAPAPVQQALIKWHDELFNALQNEEPLALPFFEGEDDVDLSDDGDVVAWCIGFVDAMYADETGDWFFVAEHEDEIADLTLPMVVLSGIAADDAEIQALRDNDSMAVRLVNRIEDNLMELFLLFHEQ